MALHPTRRRVLVAGGAAGTAAWMAACTAPESVWDPEPSGPPGEGGSGLRLDPEKVPRPEYVALLEEAAAHCAGIDAPTLAAQIETESNWVPDAVSPAGAAGISQFMPATWAQWGYDANGDGATDVMDPADAIPSQGALMCALHQQVLDLQTEEALPTGDTLSLTLAAYNAGLGPVLLWRGVPPFHETQQYIAKITDRRNHFALPGSGGGTPVEGYEPAPEGCPSTGNEFEAGLLAPALRGLRCLLMVHRNQIITSGWRPQGSTPNSDHPLGLAVDAASSTAWNTSEGVRENWLLAHWLQVNADRLGVTYIIFHSRIWNLAAVDAWAPYTHPGGSNPSLDHANHVHVSFRSTGGEPQAQMRGHAPRQGDSPTGIWVSPEDALG